MNRLVRSIARAAGEHPLSEKWLIAPSLRAGYQWLDSAAAGGQPLLNLRVKTLRKLALEFADNALHTRGLGPLHDREGFLLAALAFNRLRNRSAAGSYLLSLEPGPALLERLYRTLSDIRLAGLSAGSLRPDCFEVGLKGREIAGLLSEYLNELHSRRLADYALILELAAESASKEALFETRDILLLLPEICDPSPLERRLIQSLPGGRTVTLEADQPNPDPGRLDGGLTDARRLAWLSDPRGAPAPAGDGTLEIFQAVGEANEVREVFRRILSRGWRLDQVEVLHTDTSTYVPLFFEIAQAIPPLEEEGGGPELPLTFAEGIPVRYSRPARALGGWLAWIAEGHPQSALAGLIREGLLEVPGAERPGLGFSFLADLLGRPGIGAGASRYLPKIDQWLGALDRRQASSLEPAGDGEGEPRGSAAGTAGKDLEGGRLLRPLVARLMAISTGSAAEERSPLDRAHEFLTAFARSVTEMDNFARQALLERIEELQAWIGSSGEDPGFDLREYLADLAGSVNILGSGPRPGKLHLAGLASGGHSGRPVTFILGLDDNRFPGIRHQDPILLDSEREGLSSGLPTAGSRLDRLNRDFHRLLAALRGRVILSFSGFDPLSDRETFPAQVLLPAFRILSGDPEADRAGLLKALSPPVSFAPAEACSVCSSGDWWLWRLCGKPPAEDSAPLIFSAFPHLERGALAERNRDSSLFTEYDGYVGEAGPALDPTKDEGPVMSASRLQTIGRCPLAYFYQYVLGIEPEEPEPDPALWLNPLAAGSLLHEVFYRFIGELLSGGRQPEAIVEHGQMLEKILDREVEHYRELYPPSGESAFRRTCRLLQQTVRSFLAAESGHRGQFSPVYLEAAVGMRPKGRGTALDSEQPVRFVLDDGSAIRVRGRIDRIDLAEDETGGTYLIIDYKTGGSGFYSKRKPFNMGRVVQPAIYLDMAAGLLREKAGPEARAVRFEFFFPGVRDRGRRLSWSPEELAAGPRVAGNLCRIAARGAWLATNDKNDCLFCGFKKICGDLDKVTGRAGVKLEDSANGILDPLRELRADE